MRPIDHENADPAELLLQAYRQTSFFVETPGGRLCLRIGEPHAGLDSLLATHRAPSWAYVTAYNPGSMILSKGENERRQSALERVIVEAGLPFFRGEGVGDDVSWPVEPSILILGITRVSAVALGRRFGQRAIVYGEAGGSPQLLECEKEVKDRLP